MKILQNIQDYEAAVSYISSIPRFADKNDFKYMSAFYRYLYVERDECRVFHIAGTNGKGSTCSYLESIHLAMGKKIGMFTSPHLVDIRERIRINGEMISEECFFRAFCQVAEAYERFTEQDEFADYRPTYFAWFFLVAAAVFYNEKTDAIIWETGLGGRLDATNTIIKKDVCVITEIGLDHMEYLGDTVAKIANEKAGIIRENVPLVIADHNKEATDVLFEAANVANATIKLVSDYEKTIVFTSHLGIDFSYKSSYYNNAMFKIGTNARYQVENASLALSAMESVYEQSEISIDILRDGLLMMKWPGRMEEIEPGIIFDGAHNVDGIEAFLESVAFDECRGKRILLFSAVTDKQADKMLGMICKSDLFATIALAHIDNTRGIETESLQRLAAGIENTQVYANVMEAYGELRSSLSKGDRLYVCGSLYLIAELKRAFLQS